MSSVIATIFLGICAVTDFRKNQIWWPVAVLFMAASLGVHIVQGEGTMWNYLLGIGLGMFLWIISWITGEAIGYGDGLTVAVCGAVLGIGKAAQILLLALVFSAAWSILLLLRRAGRKDRFPFVPFLLAAWLCLLI